MLQAHLQQGAGTQGDAQLQGVEAIAVADGPLAPDVGRLADGAVAAAGHVAQDAVEQVRLLALWHKEDLRVQNRWKDKQRHPGFNPWLARSGSRLHQTAKHRQIEVGSAGSASKHTLMELWMSGNNCASWLDTISAGLHIRFTCDASMGQASAKGGDAMRDATGTGN